MEQGHHNRKRSLYNCRRPEGCLDTAAAGVTDATLAPHPRVYSLPGPRAIGTRASSGYNTLYIALRPVSSHPGQLSTIGQPATPALRPHLHGDPDRLTALGVSQDVTH